MKYFTPISGKREGLKPPELYEYFLDNFWFKASGLENEIINEPLRGERKADVVIIGGGYTGLSSAYNIHRRFPGGLGSGHAKWLTLLRKCHKNVSKSALIDRFSYKNCPIKRLDEKGLVQKDIIYQVMFGISPTGAISENFY